MAHRFTRLAQITVAAMLGFGVLTACTSGGNDAGDEPTVSSAPKTTDISDIGESADANQVGEDVRAAMAALTSYRMVMVQTTQTGDTELVSNTTVLVDLRDPAAKKVQSTSETQGQTITMIQIGDQIYTKLPGQETFSVSTAEGSSVPEAGGADQLFTQAQQVRFVGDEDFDGVPVRHYLLLDNGATIDVYVNSDDLVLKTLTSTNPVGAPGDPSSPIGASTVQVTWHDFNVDVGIVAPDPADVQG